MDDVETMLGVPVLAIVPKNIKLLHKQPTDVPDAEAYRILRTNIEFNRKSADANTISMVSGGPGEGKSTTLCNLAFTCAQGGYSVLIVDADLRRPTQHKLFEVNNNVGLTNYLTTNIALEDVILSTTVENLSLMPSGILPADAVGILNSQRMSDMIAELKARYDIIFFDSPPILGVSDGAVLASEVDQSIIIVQHRRFPARHVATSEAGHSKRGRHRLGSCAQQRGSCVTTRTTLTTPAIMSIMRCVPLKTCLKPYRGRWKVSPGTSKFWCRQQERELFLGILTKSLTI